MSSIVSQPDVTVNIVPATTDIANLPQRILFVGQKTSAGSAVAGALVENILNDNSEDALFGARSMLAGMIRDAKALNKVTIMDAIALDDDGAGVAAAGAVVFSGTATAAGTLKVTIGSRTNHSYDIAVANGATATSLGALLVAAMAADTQCPASGINTAGSVAVTASNKGLVGNLMGLRVEGTVAGITTSITIMAAGATDPTLTNVFSVVGDKRYQTVVWPYTATTVLLSFLDARFNVSNNVLDGVGVMSRADSLANHLTALGSLNSQSLVRHCDKTVSETSYKGPAILELEQSKAAQVASIRGLRRTDGANISQFVITRNGALDSFGGPALSSKPYFNTPMPNLPIISTGKGWQGTESEQLKTAGGFVMGNNTAGNSIIIDELVTTYKTDSASNADLTFKYLNYVDTASAGREYFYNNLKSQYAQSRLTEGDLVPGRDMANANSIAAFCTKLYSDLSGPDYVLTQAGETALQFFNDRLSVSLNLLTGTVTILMSVPIVTQLRTIVATFKIEFSTNS